MIEKILFFLTIVLFSFGQLGRISFFDQQINVYLYEIAVIALLFILLIKYRLDPVKSSFKQFRYIYLFFVWLLFSYIIGAYQYTFFENIVGLLYWLRLAFYFLFLLYLSFHVNKNKSVRSIIKDSLIVFIVLTIITSFTQYFLYPQLRNLIYLGWDEHLYRMFGTFFDTAIAGGIYGLTFLYIYLNKDLFIKKRHIRYLLLGLLFSCIMLTYSRTLYLSFGLLMIYLLIKKRSISKLILLSGIFSILLLIIPKPVGEGVNLVRTTSIVARVKDYNSAFQIWLKNPVIGIGYNRIRYVKERLGMLTVDDYGINHAAGSFHSTFLIVLVTAGVPGLMLFALALWQICRQNSKILIYIIFLSLLSLSDNILFHPFILYLLFLISNG